MAACLSVVVLRIRRRHLLTVKAESSHFLAALLIRCCDCKSKEAHRFRHSEVDARLLLEDKAQCTHPLQAATLVHEQASARRSLHCLPTISTALKCSITWRHDRCWRCFDVESQDGMVSEVNTPLRAQTPSNKAERRLMSANTVSLRDDLTRIAAGLRSGASEIGKTLGERRSVACSEWRRAGDRCFFTSKPHQCKVSWQSLWNRTKSGPLQLSSLASSLQHRNSPSHTQTSRTSSRISYLASQLSSHTRALATSRILSHNQPPNQTLAARQPSTHPLVNDFAQSPSNFAPASTLGTST